MERNHSPVLSLVGALLLAAGCGSADKPPSHAVESTTTVRRALTAPLPAVARVFGQPDLKQTNYNEVVAHRSFHPAGVHIDRSPVAGTPSRVYVWDSGNNRILGFDNFGTCAGGTRPGAACTETSFCGAGGSCVPSATPAARFAIGQPSTAGQGACNGDNTTAAPASSASLCLVPYPYQISPLEGPRGGQMATDAARNLYVVDTFNNRVLRYSDPFTSDRLADQQWGQSDPQSRLCNRGGAPGADTLCTGEITPERFAHFFTSAVSVSPDGQKIWVADPGNHRVVRFNPGQAAATVVLGQPTFTSTDAGCDNSTTDGSRMCVPTGIAYDAVADILYVLDAYVVGPHVETARILVYRNPNTSGQAPTSIWQMPVGTRFKWPRGLTLEKTGGALWVSDTDNSRALRFVNGAITHVVSDNDLQPDLDGWGCSIAGPCHNHGSIGIDNDGALYLADVVAERVNKYASGTPLGQPARFPVAYLFDNPGANDQRHANRVGPAGLANPGYVTFAGSQLLVADRGRILFWNNYATGTLAAGNASGVLGQPSFTTQADVSVNQGFDFTSLAHDGTRARLYATHGPYITVWSTSGGLATGRAALEQIYAPGLTMLDGRALICTQPCTFPNLYVDAARDVGWLTDAGNHRVLRVRGLSTSARRVDLVLGQNTLSDSTCNRGSGVGLPRPNGFCEPSQVSFDTQGNLYVVDGTWECRDGNCRIVAFNASKIPAPTTAVQFPNLNADRGYGPSTFDSRACDPSTGRLCSPRFVAFDPRDNSMVATGDAYSNPLDARVALWANPLAATSPLPTSFLGLRINQAGNVAFDGQGRMAILDHTWNRVVLYALPTPPAAIRTAFRTASGTHYITAEGDGGGAVSTNRTTVGAWEIFTLEDINGGQLMSGDSIYIRHDRASDGKKWYASADANASGAGGGGGAGSVFRVNKATAAGWERFIIAKVGGGQIVNGDAITLRAFNPYYVSAINGGGRTGDGSVLVDRAQAGGWETFRLIFQ
ncbi:MAG TPA: hypothetical protein VGF45_13985 [Polyangia bacterium]